MFKFKYIAVLITLVSCKPYLSERTTGSASYTTNEKCSRGPFRIRTTTLGTRWGERLFLTIFTDQEISFKVTATVGTKTTTWVHGEMGEEGRCSKDMMESLSAERAGETWSAPPKGRTSAVLTSVYNYTTMQQDLSTALTSSQSKAIARKRKGAKRYQKALPYVRYDQVILDHKIQDLETKPLPKGIPITILIWSPTPVRFDKMYVQITQSQYRPSNEKKWVKALKKKQK